MSDKQFQVEMDGGFDEVEPLMQTIQDDIRELVGEEAENATESFVDDKTEENWESDDNLETDEVLEKTDDELEGDGLRNMGFQETEQDNIFQEAEAQGEGIGEDDRISPKIEPEEKAKVNPIDEEELSPKNQPVQADIDEQIKRLRFNDETTPFTRLNNKGLRQFKKRINSISRFEDRFSEYARVDLPAHKAAWEGNLEALEHVFILKHKQGVPCIDRLGATPLHIAARRNQANVIR